MFPRNFADKVYMQATILIGLSVALNVKGGMSYCLPGANARFTCHF